VIRAAIYCRVSTADQNVEAQRLDCLALVESRGWSSIPEHVIEETASGAADRPGWGRILELVAERRVQRVVAWSLDRVGRSLWMIADTVRDLDRQGVPLVTVKEPFLEAGAGLTNTAGMDPGIARLMSKYLRDQLVATLGFVADFERQRLIERTRAGLNTARRNGRVGGRPRAFAGAALADALDLRLSGKTWGEIREHLITKHRKKLPRGTIQRAVQRLQTGLG
jgi:DNA invertase Pin-like site-specific DNA recombinase